MCTYLAKQNETESITMSAAYAEAMLELMAQNSKVMELEADLGRSMLGADTLKKMRNDFPNQFVDCGIQEANMIGVACGLSFIGRIPFAHTFAAFASRRVVDQAFISGSYSRANVRIIGSDPGVTSAFNGGTHMPFEDIGCYRAFPEMTILEPSDSTMMKALVKTMAEEYGMFYMRTYRKAAVKIYEEGTTFTIGKAKTVCDGSDATIIAEGIMVSEAMAAAQLLEKDGLHVRVLDMFTIKPLDVDAVRRAAIETGALVTAENHNIINGLGSAVAEFIAGNLFVPMERVGVQDQFGEVGPMDYLKQRFGLTAADIAAAVKRVVAKK